MRTAASGKVPHFFRYAKGKSEGQVEPVNPSTVNRLETIVQAPNLRFNAKALGKFDYRMLMCNPALELQEQDLALVKTFKDLIKNCSYTLSNDEETINNYGIACRQIRQQLLEIDSDIIHITDVLVKQLFGTQQSRRKRMFWGCFGDVVLENLRRNVDTHTIMCAKCGKRILPASNRQYMCPECAIKQEHIAGAKRAQRSWRTRRFGLEKSLETIVPQ